MNGILINGVFHEAIQSDTASFKCDQCSLKDFCEEIDKFYENIDKEIRTYYEDEELSKHIIEKIKEIYATEVG